VTLDAVSGSVADAGTVARSRRVGIDTYDQLNRLTQKSYPDSTSVNYIYDNDSRLTQVTDSTGAYQFVFDNMGRLTGTTTSYNFVPRAFTASYAYDAASNRTGFTDPENGTTSYVYDTLNRLQTLTPPAAISGGSFGFGYDALSRRTSLTRPNAVNTSYSYDNLSRLLSVTHANAGVTLDGATYTVDNAGNRLSKTDLQAGATSNYTYDPIYQLTGVTKDSTTSESDSYDPVGNRLSSLGVSSYNNNASNELTSTPTTSYTYDANGNMITKTDSTGTTTYTWDFENRLISVTLPGTGGTVSFKYDPFGRRIYKSSSSGTSIYAYDTDSLIEETNGIGGVIARYAQGLYIDEPLAMLRSGAASYYHADGLGSVTSLSNAAGALAQTYTFDSFGKQTASSGSLTNPFQYAAREFDTETSLYNYRARYYSQSDGRFLSEDPIRFRGGPNFYAYTGNNPTNFTDPQGLLKVCCRPVRIPGARQLGACHCFLQTGDGHTFGGYFEFPYLNPQVDKKDDTQPKDAPVCKDVGGCDADAKAQKAFGSIPKDLNIYGPNGTSNTVAQQILNGAGIPYTLPSCAWAGGYSGQSAATPTHPRSGATPRPLIKKEHCCMPSLRYVATVMAMLLSGWSLLAIHGLRTAAQDRVRGWEIYKLPSHPTLLMMVYISLGAALPFLSAWLMRPWQTDRIGEKGLAGLLWQNYLFRLGFSIVCGFLAALLLAFITMAFLDSR
jgi:RHS repeat-associated protein